MFTLIDVLQREHLSMRELLSRMQEEVEGEGTPDYGLLAEILEYCQSYPGAYHHPKEDLIFRALWQQVPDRMAEFEDLEAEHMVMASAVAELKRLVDQAAAGDAAALENLPQKIGAYLRFYRIHMRREEREFFPLALECLSEEQWLALGSQVVDPTDPFFAERAASRVKAMMARP